IARLAALPNCFFLGPKAYGDLPGYVAHFDVATIPFRLNAITHSCSPVKLFEYMAAGKPVVTTPMREVLKYRSVLIGDTPQAFLEQVGRALLLRYDPGYRDLLAQEAAANTWTARAETLLAAAEAARVGRSAAKC
ncbi:MAG: glycosyltransferase, partial [Armatimonadota bacterium]|nr:glycosyltransferase [Armatimonadota bacterium]